jgi:hypothetical protein
MSAPSLQKPNLYAYRQAFIEFWRETRLLTLGICKTGLISENKIEIKSTENSLQLSGNDFLDSAKHDYWTKYLISIYNNLIGFQSDKEEFQREEKGFQCKENFYQLDLKNITLEQFKDNLKSLKEKYISEANYYFHIQLMKPISNLMSPINDESGLYIKMIKRIYSCFCLEAGYQDPFAKDGEDARTMQVNLFAHNGLSIIMLHSLEKYLESSPLQYDRNMDRAESLILLLDCFPAWKKQSEEYDEKHVLKINPSRETYQVSWKSTFDLEDNTLFPDFLTLCQFWLVMKEIPNGKIISDLNNIFQQKNLGISIEKKSDAVPSIVITWNDDKGRELIVRSLSGSWYASARSLLDNLKDKSEVLPYGKGAGKLTIDYEDDVCKALKILGEEIKSNINKEVKEVTIESKLDNKKSKSTTSEVSRSQSPDFFSMPHILQQKLNTSSNNIELLPFSNKSSVQNQ